MSATPTLKQEIDRKSFETVEWLFTSVSNGKMTPAQFSTGIDTLFMAVSGLADENVADLITAADAEARREIPTVKIVLMRANNVISLTWAVGSESIVVMGYQDGIKQTEQTKHYDTAFQACAAQKKAAAKLAAVGYIKL